MPSLIVKTPPTAEPISVADMKSHLKVDIPDDDALIGSYITSARRTLEQCYSRVFMTQSLVLGRDYFPAVFGVGWGYAPTTWLGSSWMGQYEAMELRYGYIQLWPPVQSITSIKYTDTSGNVQTLSSSVYTLDSDADPGRVGLQLGQTWPTAGPILGAVKIEFVAGYASVSAIPGEMLEALRLLVGTYYENRESAIIDTRLVAVELPQGVQALMAPYQPALVR